MAKIPSGSLPRLGKGLHSLLGPAAQVQPPNDPAQAAHVEHVSDQSVQASNDRRLRSLPIASIMPGPFQPRRSIDEASLRALADSIRTSGVMQPVLVRPAHDRENNDRANEYSTARFELVAGERRWRAAQQAGLETIPAIVVTLSDEDAAAWGIVENVQREDLNPMDRAHGLRALAERFSLSQAEIAARIGVERPTVANLIRLTELEPEIQGMVSSGAISGGHARALLAAPAGAARLTLAQRCAANGWSVRRLEEFARSATTAGVAAAIGRGTEGLGAAEKAGAARREAAVRDIEKRLGEHLGARVRIRTDQTGRRGSLHIEFHDLDQFDGLLARMGLRPE